VIGLDLTQAEQDRVRFALRYLRSRSGGWKPLALALGFARRSLIKIRAGEKGVSPRMTMRVAKFAGVPVDDLLAGRFPPVGTCQRCGHIQDA
jgi:hypothetical protein